ncbi:MAG TPA: hypothetical protein VMG10_05300 [Gemmataceae bacterium]|nr:hypothetical protein [Gemmataceae bacterium]
MGAILWSCLALTIHQGPVQEYPMNSRGFEIPIKLDSRRAQEVQELILLVSQDQGRVWQPVDRKAPSERRFVYRAPGDGSYWFIVQEVDHKGRTIPENPERVKPSMAVIVDTVRPQVTLTAERLANGWIQAHWKITEKSPDLRSVRLDYHTDALHAGEWTPLSASLALEGKKEFDPGRDGHVGEVRVRMRLKDQAGNEGENVAVVAATGAPEGSAPTSSPSARPAEGGAFSLIPASQADSSGQPNQLTSQQRVRPPLAPPPSATQGASAGPVSPSVPTDPSTAGASSGPAAFGGLPVAATSDRVPPSAGGSVSPPSGSAAVKIVKAREVRLDFTVAKVGPSGLGAADVYVTLDKGATWKKMPGEVPISLPKSADLHGPEPVPGSVSVQLPAEGTIYGFIVAVKSKAGLAPPPPRPGDPPEVLVELDTTVPKAQMFRPQPDTNQPNTLILAWTAVDRNLADKPITLEWAEQKDGPWNVIGEGPMPNSSQYPWRLPEHLPPRVYLRLTVRDLAGNEARAQTDKPELIDLSVPLTKIIGVAPNGR